MQDPATVEQQNGACIALEGRTFASLNELECGLTPDGVGRCHWQISFATRDKTASDFAWSHSDVGESGRVECHGETVAATTYAGAFDPATQLLTWAGEAYAAP
jgi:hypothetical protein